MIEFTPGSRRSRRRRSNPGPKHHIDQCTKSTPSLATLPFRTRGVVYKAQCRCARYAVPGGSAEHGGHSERRRGDAYAIYRAGFGDGDVSPFAVALPRPLAPPLRPPRPLINFFIMPAAVSGRFHMHSFT